MADTDTSLKPMEDGDILPPSDTEFEPAAPLKNAGVDFEPAEEAGPATARQALKDGAGKLGVQATDKLRAYADDGKARAGTALDQLSQLLNDAASTVDEKLGEQYGQYARTAAGTVTGFADQIRAKDVDELLEDARAIVRKSPAVAVGAAAALGFVVARLIQSGLENGKA